MPWHGEGVQGVYKVTCCMAHQPNLHQDTFNNMLMAGVGL